MLASSYSSSKSSCSSQETLVSHFSTDKDYQRALEKGQQDFGLYSHMAYVVPDFAAPAPKKTASIADAAPVKKTVKASKHSKYERALEQGQKDLGLYSHMTFVVPAVGSKTSTYGLGGMSFDGHSIAPTITVTSSGDTPAGLRWLRSLKGGKKA